MISNFFIATSKIVDELVSVPYRGDMISNYDREHFCVRLDNVSVPYRGDMISNYLKNEVMALNNAFPSPIGEI